MADDYIAMQARIAAELINEPVTTAQIKTAINTAIRHYRAKPFFFNQSTTGTFNTVADQENYSSADLAAIATLSHITAMKVTLSGTTGATVPVLHREFDDIEDIQDGTVTGRPNVYAYFNQQIRLYPIPDAAYAVTFAFYQRFAELSGDTDTNAWMTDGEELIRQRAKIILALDNLHSEELAKRCRPLEQDALKELNAESRLRMGTQVLRPEAMPVRAETFNINQG